jgi:arylsulfatase A-like enzyme
MLTGLYPTAHGVTRPRTALAEGISTLPEILGSAGFATAGVVSNRILGKRFGMARGFEYFSEQHVLGHRGVSTELVTATALEMLDQVTRDGERFFLFVHYFDPHYTYHRHDEYGFAAERAGRLEGGEEIAHLRQLGTSLTEEEVGFVRDLYDGEIRFTDEGIGRLLDALQEKGLDDETLVVFAADHGEEFLERGWLGHTRTLYDELVRVPLILRLTSEPERSVIEEPVSLTRVAPTILELLGIEVPESLPQPSLTRQLAAKPEEPSASYVLTEVDFVPVSKLNRQKITTQQSLIGPRYKLIRNILKDELELYDLLADPAESDDLAARQPGRVREMERQLDELLDESRARAVQARSLDLSDEEIRALKALGYGE